MRPVVKNKIAIFTPQGFIDGVSAPAVITQDDVEYIKRLKVKAVVISLAKIVFFNKNGLGFLTDALLRIAKTQKIEVGFFEYTPKIYNNVLQFFKGTPEVHLMQSQSVMEILIGGRKVEGEKILVYATDSGQKGTLLMKLKENGIESFDFCSNKEEYKLKITNQKYDITLDTTYLANLAKKVSFYTKGNAVIYTIDGYIDGSINDKFDIGYHKHSLSVGFKVFIFNAEAVKALNTHAINFFNRLAVDAAEFDASICICGLNTNRISKLLIEDLKSGGIIFENTINDVLKNKDLMSDDDSYVRVVKQKPLNKQLIQNLSIFVDSTADTMEIMTAIKAQKGQVSIKDFEIEKRDDLVAASMAFYGDLDGILVLIFPRAITYKACKLLINCEPKDVNEELDALGELINIILGKVKTQLSHEDLDIDNTLPRTFKSIEAIQGVMSGRKGVFVDMSFESDPFYFFLTR